MKKKITILISILLLLIIGGSLTYYFMFEAPKKGIAERCAGYVPNWQNFIDCHGVIAFTDSWDVDYISLKDHIHDYEIARIYNLDQLIYVADKIFVINRNTIKGTISDSTKTQYYQELFQNGQLETNYYDSISDIPTYLVIDYVSGEVKAYSDINEVPQDYKQYFSEIQNN